MKKFNALLVAGVLAASVGALASCGGSKAGEYDNDKLNESVLKGSFEDFGGGDVDLILKEGGKCLFDVTTEAGGQFDTIFDREGTYHVADGVYTFTVEWTDQEGKPVKTAEYKSTEKDGKHSLEYIMYGQREIKINMTGKLTK